MSLGFVQCIRTLPRILEQVQNPVSRRKAAKCDHTRRALASANGSGRKRPPEKDNRNNSDHENEEEEDPVLSRRVFLAGVSATTVVTALAGYRFVVGEDTESRIRRRLSQRFPMLFPREATPEERRLPLDARFAQMYFDAVRDVATQMRILSAGELRREEEAVQARAFSLFFDEKPVRRSVADPAWLNFVIYSRLHVVAQRTSPKERVEFVDRLARRTMHRLATKPVQMSEEEARLDSERWLNGIRALLKELVGLGWISGFRVEEFDGGPGSSWQDERRASLTVYSLDPVTMQAAQLIGEEQYEEISPKLSGWIKAYLMDSGITVTFEDYYLDDTYRPDPEQFKPSQLATQFDLTL